MAKRKRKNIKRNGKKSNNVSLEKLKTKSILCSRCNKTYVEVDADCIGAYCFKCTVKLVGSSAVPSYVPKKTSNRPRGWKFMNEFVDSDGTVFHKGVEVPKLKGKRPISDVESIKNEQKRKVAEKKKKQKERELKKEERLVKEYKKKQKAKKKAEEQKNIEIAKKKGLEVKNDKKPKSKRKNKPATKRISGKSKSTKKQKKNTTKKTANTTNEKLTYYMKNKLCEMYESSNYKITTEILDKFKMSRHKINKILTSMGY